MRSKYTEFLVERVEFISFIALQILRITFDI